MLLSSQAFSGFLQELSESGVPAPNVQGSQQKPKHTQPQHQSTKKDVAPQNAALQMHAQQPRISMALIPETPVDFSAFQPSNAWMSALPNNDFQVFAVTELPEAPVLDLEVLSGKSKSSLSFSKPSKDIPQLPDSSRQGSLSTEEPETLQTDDSVDLDKEAFALYFASPISPLDQLSVPDDTPCDKDEEISEEDKLSKLKQMCSDLDEACRRLADFTPPQR